MPPKKIVKINPDLLPRCEHCAAGEFERGLMLGECHLLPMDWVMAPDNELTPMWKPARRDGYCLHFTRKVDA